MQDNTIIISVAVIFRKYRGKKQWLVTKQNEDSIWELPRIITRKTEASARASIRMAGEQLGMAIQVLEEAGRAGGVITINGKIVPQRHLYYLAILRDQSGEEIGFEDFNWLKYADAVRRLPQKRDRQMIKAARKELRAWLRKEENKDE